MALQIPGISNIPNVLKGNQIVLPGGYRSAESAQTENFKYATSNTNNYVEIHTVPAGKTWYVSTIVMQSDTINQQMFLATGTGGAEVIMMEFVASAGQLNLVLPMPTPIKFSSGTRVAFKMGAAQAGSITLIGWEE